MGTKEETKVLPKYLNLGSGNRQRPQEQGWINIDIDKSTNPDIVRDLNKCLPFEDNSIDRVYCSHVIEHIEDVYFFMYEIWRVCKPDAYVEMIAPNHVHPHSIYPNHNRFIRHDYFDTWKPTEMLANAVMNYNTETSGAEFFCLHESEETEGGAINFLLQVIKEESRMKKKLKEHIKDDINRFKTFLFIPNLNEKPVEVIKEKKKKRILNFGCGPKAYKAVDKDEEVINIDKEVFWKPDINIDAELGLPFEDNSIDEIFSAHFLEHISPKEMDFFMFECWRVLKDKGKFVCIVPIGKSWQASPYHVAPMSERTPGFFTIWNHPEITGFNFKLLGINVKKRKVDDKEVDWDDELHFGLEAIK